MNKSNIANALNFAKKLFVDNNIKDAELSAELLLSDVCSLNRQQLYSHFDDDLDLCKQQKFLTYVNERLKNEPIQYILGYSYFYDLKIFVDNSVLIPRPETEYLIDLTLNKIKKNNINILDLCTGSGCIACALAHNLKNSSVTAIDVSQSSLNLAKKNVSYHNLENQIKLLKADILDDLSLKEKYDLIISNPPYVAIDVYNKLDSEVKNFEPKDALVSGDNGLEFYPYIFNLTKKYLTNNGLLAVEIFEDHAIFLKSECTKYGLKNVRILKDMAGKDRYLFGIFSSDSFIK